MISRVDSSFCEHEWVRQSICNCKDQSVGDVQGTASSSQYQNEHSPSQSALSGGLTWPTVPISQCHQRQCQKNGGKNHRVYMKKSTDCPCFLVLIPSHFLSLLYQNTLHVLIEYGITVAGFQKTSSPNLLCILLTPNR